MFEKQFGNTKLRTLEYKLELYKQKHLLKTSGAKLKYQKILYQRKVINCQFANNPRQVFCQMKGIASKVEVLPSKNNVEQFWSNIWGNKGNFNHNAEWLKLLESSYCPNIIEKDYSIRTDTVKKAIQKLQLKKSPGPDLITGLLYKKLSSFIPFMANLFQRSLNNIETIPDWLDQAKTVLLPKNERTQEAKSYRPIACLNIMYKLYTSCLNSSLPKNIAKC